MATTPTQLRIPPDLLSAIDAAAKREGVSRTAWLLQAAKSQLPLDAPKIAAKVAPSGPEPEFTERVRYRCPNGCGHEALSPVRCNFCRRTLIPYGPLDTPRTEAP